MAPTRNPSSPAPRARAAPYQTRSMAISSTKSSNTSRKAKRDLINDNGDYEDDGGGEDKYAVASGCREKCSPQQTAELEALFWISKGLPTRLQKQEIAARLKKSYHSTAVWVANRRHHRDEGKKPWFLVPGATDPAIDPNAPLYPLKGINHESPAKKARKQKRAGKTGGSKRKASSKVTEKKPQNPTPISTRVQFLNPLLEVVSVHNSVTPETSHSSGDSNGSAIPSPRISNPTEISVEALPEPKSDELPALNEAEAASILLGMNMGHGDPFNTYAQIGLQLTPYVLPVAERYTESSVRTWPRLDAEVTSQRRVLSMGLSH